MALWHVFLTYISDSYLIVRELERLNVRFTAMMGNGDDTVQQSPEVTVEQVNKDYKLNLPFHSLDNFQAFNTKLKKDKNLKRKLKSSLEQLLHPNNVLQSVINILREFFMPDLANNISTHKGSSNKNTILLKNTNFRKCMIGVLISSHENKEGNFIDANYVADVAKIAFSHAKHWAGPRRQTVQE